jgi:hypothetical protein
VSDALPRIAPPNRHFYLVHEEKGKKTYFKANKPGGKGQTPRLTTTHVRECAMKFTSLELADSFLAYVNNGIIFPHGLTYKISLEPAGYQSERLSTKMELTSCIA